MLLKSVEFIFFLGCLIFVVGLIGNLAGATFEQATSIQLSGIGLMVLATGSFKFFDKN